MLNLTNSRKTAKILKTPLDRLCQRCLDQIKWRIAYKKYKPLTCPSRCVDCQQKTIIKAYRSLCDTCASKKVEVKIRVDGEEKIIQTKRCSKCVQPTKEYAAAEKTKAQHEEEAKMEDKRITEILDGLKEREKKKILRKL